MMSSKGYKNNNNDDEWINAGGDRFIIMALFDLLPNKLNFQPTAVNVCMWTKCVFSNKIKYVCYLIYIHLYTVFIAKIEPKAF